MIRSCTISTEKHVARSLLNSRASYQCRFNRISSVYSCRVRWLLAAVDGGSRRSWFADRRSRLGSWSGAARLRQLAGGSGFLQQRTFVTRGRPLLLLPLVLVRRSLEAENLLVIGERRHSASHQQTHDHQHNDDRRTGNSGLFFFDFAVELGFLEIRVSGYSVYARDATIGLGYNFTYTVVQKTAAYAYNALHWFSSHICCD